MKKPAGVVAKVTRKKETEEAAPHFMVTMEDGRRFWTKPGTGRPNAKAGQTVTPDMDPMGFTTF